MTKFENTQETRESQSAFTGMSAISESIDWVPSALKQNAPGVAPEVRSVGPIALTLSQTSGTGIVAGAGHLRVVSPPETLKAEQE